MVEDTFSVGLFIDYLNNCLQLFQFSTENRCRLEDFSAVLVLYLVPTH